jgi:FkbM family methyltransferase
MNIVDLDTIEVAQTKYSQHFYYYKNDSVIGESLRQYGEYAQLELNLLLSILTNASVVYDIGGNVGVHATAFSTVANTVLTFEPNAQNFALLQKNANSPNVILLNNAVGDVNAEVFCDEIEPNADNSNYGNVKLTDHGQPVFMLTIDHVVDKLNLPPPSLIKIDVEGYEYKVLLGSKNTLVKYAPVLYYEAHETKELTEIYEFLTEVGYKKFYWVVVPNFNANNFAKNRNNVFSSGSTVSILAFQSEVLIEGLEEVSGPHDHLSRLTRVLN